MATFNIVINGENTGIMIDALDINEAWANAKMITKNRSKNIEILEI